MNVICVKLIYFTNVDIKQLRYSTLLFLGLFGQVANVVIRCILLKKGNYEGYDCYDCSYSECIFLKWYNTTSSNL